MIVSKADDDNIQDICYYYENAGEISLNGDINVLV